MECKDYDKDFAAFVQALPDPPPKSKKKAPAKRARQ
jgi:hypothetical protein